MVGLPGRIILLSGMSNDGASDDGTEPKLSELVTVTVTDCLFVRRFTTSKDGHQLVTMCADDSFIVLSNSLVD